MTHSNAPTPLAVKVIVVTGAESGIGKAIATVCASQGAELLPLRRVAEPEELARLVAFALSDAAPSMTGTLLKVDSGRTTS